MYEKQEGRLVSLCFGQPDVLLRRGDSLSRIEM